ncbi:exopolysaccharide production repressor exox [Agrobacterium sp. a22-2]|uniref:exopolysaccharide production repressor protein n=1 Tax=Agrobacterium sp. a22-2 TaxID=2283840 RepID=UPI0014451B3A|nr:exopolysaccharide production repressor protein [Agrobacterium sp. a22-2]NKN37277.1 exopolysaccharide production repressor exox [Agrobacterium sp. a22-2]
MYAPRVFASMIGALIVFALATYALSGSLFGTFIQTIICAILLQVGYFAATLYLVWRAARDRKPIPGASKSLNDDKQLANPTVSSLNKTGHSNL